MRSSAQETLHAVAGALHAAALATAEEGDADRGIALLESALRCDATEGRWWQDLGALQYSCRLWNDCIGSYEAAAARGPLKPQASRLLGCALLKVGHPERALKHLECAAREQPESKSTLLALGQCLRALGEYRRAAEVLDGCIELDPCLMRARWERADILGLCGFPHDELADREAIVVADPGDPGALLWLARAQLQAGSTDACIQTWRNLLRLRSDPHLHSEYLSALLHQLGLTALELKAAHQEWAALHSQGRQQVFANTPDPDRRLRLGYMCGESRRDPSRYFLTPLLMMRDRVAFDVTWYESSPGETRCYSSLADRWRKVAGLSAEDVAARVREDEIDILVDVSGHYDHHRLDVFAQRPAPVQAAFPNYPCTTGVPSIEYIFTDEWVCPTGAEGQYQEQAVRVPGGYLTYAPPAAPEVSPSPAESTGYITFGIFQRPAKYNAAFWDAVARILLRVPGSRVLIHYGARELHYPESSACERLRLELGRRGVDKARVDFAGGASEPEHLGIIGRADIALDTFPYAGQTTTCECLWMGVPVVTVAGSSHVSRVGAGILTRAGLAELCAGGGDYESIAVDLAGRVADLCRLRKDLRSRLRQSSVVSGSSVRELEGCYRAIWRRWCESKQEERK